MDLLQSMRRAGQTTAEMFNFLSRTSLEEAVDMEEYVSDDNEMAKGLETMLYKEERKK